MLNLTGQALDKIYMSLREGFDFILNHVEAETFSTHSTNIFNCGVGFAVEAYSVKIRLPVAVHLKCAISLGHFDLDNRGIFQLRLLDKCPTDSVDTYLHHSLSSLAVQFRLFKTVRWAWSESDAATIQLVRKTQEDKLCCRPYFRSLCSDLV